MELGLELLVVLLQEGHDGPVLLRSEGPDLVFPLTNEAKGHRLDPPRGEPGPDGLPQEGAHLIAHQAVQDPPGLLGLDLVHVQALGVLEGLLDSVAGDLVEGHPLKPLRRFLEPQLGGHMVCDGLSFPVRVRGQNHALGLPGHPLELLENLSLTPNRHVLGLEPLFQVHPQLLGRKVPDVADGSRYPVVLAQVTLDGPRLCRRLDDDEVLVLGAFCHSLTRLWAGPCPAPCHS